MTGPRPAESDPIFSFRWSWWRRPASMRWVGDGFEGHMATAIWVWIASRPVAAGLGLMAAGALLLGAGVANALAASCVVVGARALADRWSLWRVLTISGPAAALASLAGERHGHSALVSGELLAAHAVLVGAVARQPWIALAAAAALPLACISGLLGSDVPETGWIGFSSALFSTVSLPPRFAGLAVAALFGVVVVESARTHMLNLVFHVTTLALVFPATAVLRAANEPARVLDPTTRWVAAGHLRPWSAVAAWSGLSCCVILFAFSELQHAEIAALLCACSAWAGSHIVGGAPGVSGLLASIAIGGTSGGMLAVAVASRAPATEDTYMVTTIVALSAIVGAIVGAVTDRVVKPGVRWWIAPATFLSGVVGAAWMPIDDSLPRFGKAPDLWFGSSLPDGPFAAGAVAGAWVCVCWTLAAAARSRTTVPDDHPIHQLRELRERRARGEA